MSINLSSFMSVFKVHKTDNEKSQMIKQHIINKYIPYEQKYEVAKRIVETSCYRTVGENRKELHIDSVAKHMLTCIAIIDLYTDIERQKNDNKTIEDFNTLNSSGVLDIIIQNIDERELKEFNIILKMTFDDLITNEYENHAYISKQVEKFGSLIGTIIVPILEKFDIKQINELLNVFK